MIDYCFNYKLLIVLAAAAWIAHLLIDINFFLRMLWCYLYSKFVKKKLNVLDSSTVSSICWTTDVDHLLFHMNNTRYLRELDFARADFYSRTALWQTIRAKGGQIYQSATSIRYRKFIKLFRVFQITSKIVYWDQNSIYMEHRFTIKGDDFVRAIVYAKQRAVNCNIEEVMAELMKCPATKEPTVQVRPKPECPPEIRLWIESTNISSRKLRANVIA